MGETMEKIEQFQNLIDNAKNIVFFSGAGVSTASGIPDFRSPKGLYNRENPYKYQPEIMLSHSFYVNNTEEFFDFYKNEMCILGFEPCITHKKIAELENENRKVTVVTQNIDGLHQLAGSTNVIELHGTIYKNYCQCCGKEFSAEYVKNSEGVPYCDECTGEDKEYAIVKPAVTLYEEMLPDGAEAKAIQAIENADLLVIVGTSLNVYPAAGLIDYFNPANGKIVLVNKGSTGRSSRAKLIFDTDMNEVFSQIKA
jgi:NAD-dependent deacetylase